MLVVPSQISTYSIESLADGNVSDSRVTQAGIVTDLRPPQPSNAESPMLVTLPGITTDAKPPQSLNAESQILTTLEGIVTDVSSLQPQNV